MVEYEFRQPVGAELSAVQLLRHNVLDPARAHKSDIALSEADFDAANIHMAAFYGAQVVSTVRMDLEERGRYEAVRVATHERHRRKDLGRYVMTAAENLAVCRGATDFRLSSRLESIGFYEKLGYKVTSEVFVSEDGVPNRWMTKKVGTNG